MKKRKTNIILLLILLSAFIVRIWGINFGLPNIQIIDEQGIVYAAFYAGANWLRIADYTNGQFIVYLVAFEYGLYFIVGMLLGIFQEPQDLLISYLKDPSMLVLIGRISMVLGGVLAVWVLFVIGNKFFNPRVGYISAFLMSFSFLHAKESHYIKEDVISSLFVLTSFYFVLKIITEGKIKDYVLAGIFLGLAQGAEYKAIIFFPVVILAHFLQRKKAYLKKLVFFLISSLLTFLVINPYYIIEFNRTLESLLAFSKLQMVIYTSHLQGKPIWWWFMFEHIPQGIGYLFFTAAVVGFGICLLRARKENQYVFIPLLPFIFFVSVDLWTKMHFARYAMITLPFFALSAAVFVDAVSRAVGPQKRVVFVVGISFLLILQSIIRIVKFDLLLTRTDTRSEAKQWIEKHIKSGSKILVESTLRPEYPSNLNVPLILDEKSVNTRIKDAKKRGLKAMYLRSLKNARRGKIGYDIVATTQVGAKMDIFTDEHTRIKDVGYYVDTGVEYIALTSWVQEKMSSELEKSLHEYYQLIKEFRPTSTFKTDPHFIQMDYEALDKVDIFRKDAVFGPAISIYQLKTKKLSS